jgi:hypothetical protein
MLKALYLFLGVSVFCSSALSYQKDNKIVYGYSAIQTDSYDEWDKKNSAVQDAMKNLTYSLASELMTPEEIESTKELIDKSIIPASNLYILNTEILKHGIEQEGEYQAYQARVKFTYSVNNFKKLLKSKGVLFNSLAEPKVAAFIEVTDKERLQVYKWWEEENPKLHPALVPIHKRLKAALKEQGYILVEPKVYSSVTQISPKTMAKRAGAHYYVSGEVSVSRGKPGSISLSDGDFYFHETRSQKLVSKINVMDFKKAYNKKILQESIQPKERGIASVENEQSEPGDEEPLGPTDLLTDSFRKAVRTMNVVGDPESLTQGLTMITVKGIKNPVELMQVKDSFSKLADSGLDSFIERSLTQGEVVFLARSKQNTSVLKRIIENKTPLKNGVLSEGQEGLVFDYGSSYN